MLKARLPPSLKLWRTRCRTMRHERAAGGGKKKGMCDSAGLVFGRDKDEHVQKSGPTLALARPSWGSGDRLETDSLPSLLLHAIETLRFRRGKRGKEAERICHWPSGCQRRPVKRLCVHCFSSLHF